MGKRIELTAIFRPTKSAGIHTPVSQGASVKKTVPAKAPATSPVSPKASDPDTKFDKTAYQREYMRRYRAKKAGK
jgi:hypothetical protein